MDFRFNPLVGHGVKNENGVWGGEFKFFPGRIWPDMDIDLAERNHPAVRELRSHVWLHSGREKPARNRKGRCC